MRDHRGHSGRLHQGHCSALSPVSKENSGREIGMVDTLSIMTPDSFDSEAPMGDDSPQLDAIQNLLAEVKAKYGLALDLDPLGSGTPITFDNAHYCIKLHNRHADHRRIMSLELFAMNFVGDSHGAQQLAPIVRKQVMHHIRSFWTEGESRPDFFHVRI